MKRKTTFTILITSLILGSDMMFGRSYPLKEVSTPDCKKKFTREEHNEECKITLPRIIDAQYEKFKDSPIIPIIYSVLRGSSYDNGWDVNGGSYLGIDIPTAKGTPVYSAHEGHITFAGNKPGYGNVVVIQHNYNKKLYHSVYAHLDEILTSVGSIVQEGDLIGKVGDSGNAFGAHLKFQIDVNQEGSHPYYYLDCGGNTHNAKVNGTECREKMKENTVDPIAFIEANQGPQRDDLGTTFDISKLLSGEIKKISNDNNNDEELAIIKTPKQKNYALRFEGLDSKNIIPGSKPMKFILALKDADTQEDINGLLDEPIMIKTSKNNISITPSYIKYVSQGKIPLTLTTRGTGTSVIKMYIKNNEVASIKISIDQEKNLASNNIIPVKPVDEKSEFGIDHPSPVITRVDGTTKKVNTDEIILSPTAEMKKENHQEQKTFSYTLLSTSRSSEKILLIKNLPIIGKIVAHRNTELCPIKLSSQFPVQKIIDNPLVTNCELSQLDNTIPIQSIYGHDNNFAFKIINPTKQKIRLTIYGNDGNIYSTIEE